MTAKSLGEIRAEWATWADELPVVVRCLFCPGWSWAGPTGEGRLAAAEHQAEAHAARKGRPYRGPRPITKRWGKTPP